LRPVVVELGESATLVFVDDADHAFHVRVSSGTDDGAVLRDMADAIRRWMVLAKSASSHVDVR